MPSLAVLAVLPAGALAAATAAVPGAAHDETPAVTVPVHPVVGAWRFDTSAEDPTDPPSHAEFHGDGTYMASHPGVGVGVGAWRPTGTRTADLTIVVADIDATEDGFERGELTVRAAVEVDPAGHGLTAPYAFAGASLDGAVLFEGALTATATRIEAEPMPPAATPSA